MSIVRVSALPVLALVLLSRFATATPQTSVQASSSQSTSAPAPSQLTSAQLTAALKGSSWTGTFGASLAGIGLNGDIDIQFSPKLAPDGGVQYMHKVNGGGVLGTVVGPFDKACPSTPREMRITGTVPPDGLTGQIQKYKCREDGARVKSGKPILVKKITLTDGGRSLEIDAAILDHTVAYKLQKIDPATGNPEQSDGERVLVREAKHSGGSR